MSATALFARPMRVALALFVLGFLMNAAYLGAGWALDDFILLNALRSDPLPFARWRGLWAMEGVPAFESVWWLGEGWAGYFWRPLPSGILEASIALFGETAVPLHALALLCHAWVGAGLFLLVHRLTGRTAVAVLSALFFLGCERLGLVVGWVATMTDPICVALLMGAMLAHVDWLERRRPASLVGSLALLALAFASKESAVLAPVFLVLLSLLAPEGRMPSELSPGTLGARLRRTLADRPSWLPCGVMLVVYLGAYKALSLGSMNNLAYASPLQDPAGYLAHLVLHLPVVWLGSLSNVWPGLAMFWPEALLWMALGGVLIVAALLVAVWPLRRDPLVAFGLTGWLVALLPQVSADASERLLYLPMVALAPVLAVLTVQIGPIARRLGRPLAPLFTRLWGWYVSAGLLAPGLVMTVAMAPMMMESFSQGERELATALPIVREARAEHVVFLTTSGFFVTLYPQSILEFHLREPTDVRVLSSANGAFQLTRLDEDSIELRVDRAGWLSNMFARLMRTDPSLRVGEGHDEGLYRATITELTPDGQDALAVRFDFAVPLSDPSLLFLVWNGSAFERFDVASVPMGEVRELADTSDMTAGMM